MAGYGIEMQEQRTQAKRPEHGPEGEEREQDPALIARRELVEWCREHQLPVPEERRAQPSGR